MSSPPQTSAGEAEASPPPLDEAADRSGQPTPLPARGFARYLVDPLGWFTDICEVSVELDCTRRVDSHGFLFEESLPLFSTSEVLSGNVVLRPVEGEPVYHQGLEVRIETTMHFFDSLRTVELSSGANDDPSKIVLLEPSGYISEPMRIPFEIDLSKLELKDSYDGEIFNVQSGVQVELKRPWYAFGMYKFSPIALHSVASSPATDDECAVPTDSLAAENIRSVPRAHSMIVTCGEPPMELVKVDYGRFCHDIGSTLKGTLILKEPLGVSLSEGDDASNPKRIESVSMRLYKVEAGDGDVYEKVLYEREIFNNSENDSTPQGELIDFEFSLSAAEGGSKPSPTVFQMNTAEDPVSTRNYLRVLVKCSGKSFWQTNEVVLYRSEIASTVAAA